MKVLLVAPEIDDLPSVSREVSSIVNSGLSTHLLTGEVNAQDLLSLSDEDFDILWLSTHGGIDGVLLSDGVLSNAELARFVRVTEIPHVFLNTCESVTAALRISEESGANVICTISPVVDISAYRTGFYLAESLSDGYDFQEAYNRSKPPSGDNNYLYLSPLEVSRVRNRNPSSGLLIEKLREEIDRLKIIIDGNRDLRIRGIREDMDLLLSVVETATEERRALRESVERFESSLAMVFEGMEDRPGSRKVSPRWEMALPLLTLVVSILIFLTLKGGM